MICQGCSIEAPTKHVAFYQNIGMLVVRQMRSIEGNLCKPCITHHFLSLTLWGLLTGWWGMISLIINPFIIIHNVIRYLTCLGLEPPAEGASRPRLTEDAVVRLKPHTEALLRGMGEGRPAAELCEEIGGRAGVTPGQVLIYIQALIEASKQRPPK